MKKLISICIPCYNEIENIKPLTEELVKIMETYLQYNFDIIFSDNNSTDGTQDVIRDICKSDKRMKAIFNAKNFGIHSSGENILFQAKGDCLIFIPADFQIPLNLIPVMISEWEKGAMVVSLPKIPHKSDKQKIFRNIFYAISKKIATSSSLGSTSFGMYDKKFISICKATNDPLLKLPYMAEKYAYPLIKLTYQEQSRRSGKSKNSFLKNLSFAISRLTRTSDVLPRYAIYSGIFIGFGSFIISIYYLVRKLLDWKNFPMGMAPLIIGMFFLGAIQLIFIGIIGEYILTINQRQKNMPLVVEKERINFDNNTSSDEE